MTENFNEEHHEQEIKPHWTEGNNKTLKFLAVCLSAFLGGFLAVFALSGIIAIAHKNAHPFYPPMPPISINFDEDKFFSRMNEEFDIPAAKPVLPDTDRVNRIVNIEETPDSYKVYVNLKKFNNDEKNIDVKVKPHSIKISGNAKVDNKNEQSSFSYAQELSLSRKVDVDDVTKKRVGNRYVITLPLEND